jgi:hypothetical protein
VGLVWTFIGSLALLVLGGIVHVAMADLVLSREGWQLRKGRRPMQWACVVVLLTVAVPSTLLAIALPFDPVASSRADAPYWMVVALVTGVPAYFLGVQWWVLTGRDAGITPRPEE